MKNHYIVTKQCLVNIGNCFTIANRIDLLLYRCYGKVTSLSYKSQAAVLQYQKLVVQTKSMLIFFLNQFEKNFTWQIKTFEARYPSHVSSNRKSYNDVNHLLLFSSNNSSYHFDGIHSLRFKLHISLIHHSNNNYHHKVRNFIMFVCAYDTYQRSFFNG